MRWYGSTSWLIESTSRCCSAVVTTNFDNLVDQFTRHKDALCVILFVSMATSILDCLDVTYQHKIPFCHHKPAQTISKLLIVIIKGCSMMFAVTCFFGSFTIEVQTFAINHPRFHSLALKHSPDATVFLRSLENLENHHKP